MPSSTGDAIVAAIQQATEIKERLENLLEHLDHLHAMVEQVPPVEPDPQ